MVQCRISCLIDAMVGLHSGLICGVHTHWDEQYASYSMNNMLVGMNIKQDAGPSFVVGIVLRKQS